MQRCIHCQIRAARRGSLCWSCYENQAIRALYVPPAFEPDFYGGQDLPDEPTPACPGSPEKIAVLTARVEAHRALWHPLDGRGG